MTGFELDSVRGNSGTLKFKKGKTIIMPLIWGGSSPIDVTDFSARLCVKKDYSDSEVTFEFTEGNGRVTIGGSDGLIQFSMSAADSASLPAPFSGVYEIEVISDTGVVYQAMSGKVIVSQEVCS